MKFLIPAWHVIVVLMCAIGLAMAAKLALGLNKIAGLENSTDQPWGWWVGLGLIAILAALMVWEIIRRWRILRVIRQTDRDL